MHFYHLTEILTPVLAWGFLGSDEQLAKACNIFKVKDLMRVSLCLCSVLITH